MRTKDRAGDSRTIKGPRQAIYKIGDRVLSRLPHVPKGKSPYSAPKTVKEIHGYYTFLLSDGKIWNAHKLKPYRVQTQPTISIDIGQGNSKRSSSQMNKGVPPQRYQGGAVRKLRGDTGVYGMQTTHSGNASAEKN